MKSMILPFVLTVVLASCAGMGSSNTKRLLSASGFQTRSPKTEEQRRIYDEMEPYKLYSKEVGGGMIYSYKDPEQGVVYIGGPEEHQAYQKYAVEQQIARDQRIAAELRMDAASNWYAWGPYSPWWY